MILPTFPFPKDAKGRKVDGPRGWSEQPYKMSDVSGILYQMNYWSPGDHAIALQDILDGNLILFGTANGKDVYCTPCHSIFLVKEDMRIIRIGHRRMDCVTSRKRDLNPRPTDLQSDALPTELLRDDCIA
uniref:Uncharacterized protein n=1 Tax=viral metagenome TaxID=1070528 RepID=A0A6C0I043_9ZZZZ